MLECARCRNSFHVILSYQLCYNCWPSYVLEKMHRTLSDPRFSIDNAVSPERREFVRAFIFQYFKNYSDIQLNLAEREKAYSEAVTNSAWKMIFMQRSLREKALSDVHKRVSLQPSLYTAWITELFLYTTIQDSAVSLESITEKLNSPKIQNYTYALNEIHDRQMELIKNAPPELKIQPGNDGRERCFLCQQNLFSGRRSVLKNRCGHRFHASCFAGYMAKPLESIDVTRAPTAKGCPECNAKIDVIHGYEQPILPAMRLPHPSNFNNSVEDCAFL